jgi:malate dehydrogenase (oxaloacetate-decarboxylating)(NADP+)
MYMMVMKNSVKFFADATINVDPDADTLADIAVQVSDAVAALGITPRVGMVSFSTFGSADLAEPRKVREALALVRKARPELEIDGEMQADIALDSRKRDQHYSFSRLERDANVLIFPSLSAGNAAYKVLCSLGRAQAVGPMLLGIAKPVAFLQPDSTVEDIFNMTAYTVVVAQNRERGAR